MLTKNTFFKTPLRTAFFAAVVGGFLVHLFGMITIIHNYDDIFVQPFGFGSTIQSGRWALAVVGGLFHILFGTYNLSFVYGLLFLVLLGLSAAQLVAMFHIQNHKIAAAIGLLLVTFPTATSTMFFKYTAHYYGLAIFLAVVAARQLAESKRGFFLGTLFIVLSLGIYQAYLPLTIGILVLFLLKRALDDDSATLWRTLRTGLFFCLSIITALVVYRVMVDVSVVVGNHVLVLARKMLPNIVIPDFVLSDYQGINTMGQFTVASLLSTVVKAFTTFFTHPFNGYGSLTPTIVLQVLYPLLWTMIIVVVAVSLVVKKKRITHILSAVLLLLLFPVAVNTIIIMCPDSTIYTLMVYGLVLVPCAPFLLYESGNSAAIPARLGTAFKRLLAAVAVLMVSSYGIMANVNYSYMYYQTRQTENYMVSLVAQIRMTDDYTADKPWAFVGRIDDPLLKTVWDEIPMYGGSSGSQKMLNAYSQKDWISNYIGYSPTWATDAQIAKIKKTDEFKSMPVWPDAGSIRVINGCVVVRFQ